MEPAKGAIYFSFGCLLLVVPATRTPSRQVFLALGSGVVVQRVLQHSEAEKAGILEGDVFVRWARGDAHGEIQSPFDLSTTEIEQAPRGNVLLDGLRGKEKKIWQLGQDRWGLEVRPNFPDGILSLYRAGEDFATAGKLSEAAEKWRLIFDQGDSSNRQWLLFHLARLLAEARHWKEADGWYQEALQIAEADRDAVMQIHMAWGRSFVQRNDWEDAGEHFDRAMVAARAMGDNSLALATVLDELGGLAEKKGDLSKAEGYYRQAFGVREGLNPASLSTSTSLNNLGSLADLRGDLDKAEELDQRAFAMAEKIAPGSLTMAQALGNLGEVAFDRGKLAKAGEYYRRSFDIYEALEPNGLGVAKAFHRLGWLASEGGDLAKAEEYDRRALSIRERVAPDGLDVAASFTGLGWVAWQRSDLARAEELHRRALAILERLAPGSLGVANSLDYLGIVAWQRGDLGKAEEYDRQALAIRESLVPDSLDVASSLGGLGNVAYDRGDLAKAEQYDRQALAIAERFDPGSINVARALNNLGIVAWQRGDLVRAEEYAREALAIFERLAPGSLLVAESLNNLGEIAMKRADLAKAEEYQRRALAITEALAPGSRQVADILNDLGLIARERGNRTETERDYRQGLSIREKLAPFSVDMAWNLNLLAQVLLSRGVLDEAEQCYRKASAILDRLAPGSANLADSLAGLAAIRQRQGRLEEAAQLYAQALDAFEAQTARLGGSTDIRADFRAKRGNYREYMGVLLAQGKPEGAFEVLERSRARILLETLAAAHVDIRRGADPQLLEKERSLQADIRAKRNHRIRLLEEKRNEDQIKAVEKEISNLAAEYQEIEAQIRSGSPAYAALTQPKPLSAEAARRLVPEDTLLLEYSLGEPQSYVLALTTDSLHTYELPGSGTIKTVSRRLYQALTERSRMVARDTAAQQHARLTKADETLQRVSAELSGMVLGPVAGELKSRRLLIVSDGALQYVPFASLPSPGSLSRGKPAPLIVEHEIAYLPSASVLAQLRHEEKERASGLARNEVAVFADPVFDESDSRVQLLPRRPTATGNGSQERSFAEERTRLADTLARSIEDANLGQQGGFRLPRLAFTRDEAKAILSVVPRGSSKEALGFDANRALAVGWKLKQYRVVHFATHALVDNIHPELSGLVLSLVNRMGEPIEGFLGLEDIYNLDWSADLVVLSACDTGLGKELEGEGMIGLTRGFMYAGAPRVIASLWNVNDFATAKLMTYFYQAMERDGMKPAQALRQAQLAMWRQLSSSAPYYWAGFVLQGDWE